MEFFQSFGAACFILPFFFIFIFHHPTPPPMHFHHVLCVYTLCYFLHKKKSCLYVNCICTYIYRVSVCRVSVYLVSGKHVSNKSRIFLQFLLLLLLGAGDNGSAISTRKSISRIWWIHTQKLILPPQLTWPSSSCSKANFLFTPPLSRYTHTHTLL